MSQENGRNKIYILKLDRVKEVLEMNSKGEKPETLEGITMFGVENELIPRGFLIPHNRMHS